MVIYSREKVARLREQYPAGTRICLNGVKLTELHVDDWTISKLIGHKNVKTVKYYRKMSNQSMADETREARNYMSNVILANLDGWGEEYEQIRQNARIK